jgi:exodeoxyribonuclease V beta subunit
MSHSLQPLSFPLNGTRLIEASAGTGKTWTIAALYVRLVLGHGDAESAYHRPLQPAEILVMTFTRAATRELSDRIRERLIEAAQVFRGRPVEVSDPYLAALLDDYRAEPVRREQAAHRLMLAAEAMDDAAVFTIDAWCQRMLREHAFDSGSLFDEELVDSERALYAQALRDYWRHHVYALAPEEFALVHGCWRDLPSFDKAVHDLVERAHLIDNRGTDPSLAAVLARAQSQIKSACPDKSVWQARADTMEAWFRHNYESGRISRGIYKQPTIDGFFQALREWAHNADQIMPGPGFYANDAWDKWNTEKLTGAYIKKTPPDTDMSAEFAAIAELKHELEALPRLSSFVLAHAACAIAQRMQVLKTSARKFGFADMLTRLKNALAGTNGDALRRRIVARYPVAMIDEFQDTSPEQYAIFDRLYEVERNDAQVGLFLIGDPKQAIYGFRGADIHSYLAARRATEGRHYWLARNFRSADALVRAVNQLFVHAEGDVHTPGHPKGAFGFRSAEQNALPFQAVAAQGRKDQLTCGEQAIPALTAWVGAPDGYEKNEVMQKQYARACAEHIVTLLNDASVGFTSPQGWSRLVPADIAILVKNRYEAAAIQRALQVRAVPSVYLSDSDSVFESAEAADVLRWLQAVANPLDVRLVRAALASRTADVPLAELAALTSDDLAWETHVEQLKALKQVWQRHGVLAMLRRWLHELGLPERLLVARGGERRLTNLLHLAELLQRESQHLDGEQGLIRWLGEQIDSSLETGEEHVLRLESDAALVKIVTIHKSKGLEYPLVYLPFAAASRPVSAAKRNYFEYQDPHAGVRRIDFSLSDTICALADQARLEEDIRLLYVALTRARHALWLGVADVKGSFARSAFGYLANGGAALAPADLMDGIRHMAGECAHIQVLEVASDVPTSLLSRTATLAPLRAAQTYDGEFERAWTVASYSSITKSLTKLRAPSTPAQQKMLEESGTGAAPVPSHAAPWHRFPRGALPGQFVHEQLEWMLDEGFENAVQGAYREQLLTRCARSPWQGWTEALAEWLTRIVQTPLPLLDASLAAVGHGRAETEFWMPVERFPLAELDRLCQAHLLPHLPRATLSERQLTGMLHGFIDLVFEHDGRYWILDYKSTALGNDDGAYHMAALQTALVDKRYEVQGMIYLLALHRMLKARLGAGYDPQRQLGGALFFFLRGIGNAVTRGCCPLTPDLAVLEALDRLLPAAQLELT